jgi:hypothetical protein
MRVTKNSGEQYENTDGPDIAQATGEHWRPTGFWLKEFAAPYFVFKGAGIELTLASPNSPCLNRPFSTRRKASDSGHRCARNSNNAVGGARIVL